MRASPKIVVGEGMGGKGMVRGCLDLGTSVCGGGLGKERRSIPYHEWRS